MSIKTEVYETTASGELRRVYPPKMGRSTEEILGDDIDRLQALSDKASETEAPEDIKAYQEAVHPYFQIMFAEDRAAQFEADDPYYIDYLDYKAK